MRGPPISSEKLPLASTATRNGSGAARTAAAIARPSARQRVAAGSGGVRPVAKTGTIGGAASGEKKPRGGGIGGAGSRARLKATAQPPPPGGGGPRGGGAPPARAH